MIMKLDGIASDHEEAIVCCTTLMHGHACILVSGCEGGRISFADPRIDTTVGSIVCDDESAVTSLASCRSGEGDTLFASTANAIKRMDTRRGFSQESIVDTFEIGSEEINSIALSADGRYLAAGDDSAEVHVLDLQLLELKHKTPQDKGGSSKGGNRVLRRGHSNICSTVIFRKKNPRELLSGGLDCQLVRWDPHRIKLMGAWTMPALSTDPKAINPPMIHSIDTCMVDKSKEIVAVARGDGCISLYNPDMSPMPMDARSSRRQPQNQAHGLVWMAMDDDGCHNGAANAVRFCYPSYGDRPLLLSAGNDGRVCCWDWRLADSPLLDQHTHTSKINCLCSAEGKKDESGSHPEGIGYCGDVCGNLFRIRV